MAFYYTASASHTTSASAATQTLAAGLLTGTTRECHVNRVLAGTKGAAQDNQTLWQAWKPTVVQTAGTAQAATIHADGAPAAITIFSTTPTVGTKGAFPTIQLPFNSRAMVQWVGLNPDECLSLAAGAAVAGNMNWYDEEAAAVAVVIVYSLSWYEG